MIKILDPQINKKIEANMNVTKLEWSPGNVSPSANPFKCCPQNQNQNQKTEKQKTK